MNFFKPEDFGLVHSMWTNQDVATLANKLLSERGSKVYGKKWITGWEVNEHYDDTHQALLINIEELPKPECKHTPLVIVKNLFEEGAAYMASHKYEAQCAVCGIALKASWSPA